MRYMQRTQISTVVADQPSFADRLRAIAHAHDDIPAFHAGYLVATFMAAALFNLGFFLLLILVHMGLDVLKYRNVHRYSPGRTAWAVFFESLFDITLLSTSLMLSLYLNRTYGIPAVSGVIRSGMTLLLAFGTMAPKMRVLEDVDMTFFHMHRHLYSIPKSVRSPLTWGQKICLCMLGVSLYFIFLAPFIFHHQLSAVLWVLEYQLIPWRL